MNLIQILLPIEREKCLNGLEWTFMNYADSQSLGRLLSTRDDEEEDEEIQISQKQGSSISALGLHEPPSEDDGMEDPF